MNILALTLLIFISVSDTEQCEDGVCLTWSVTVYQLKLVCKVGRLRYYVRFINPIGNISAECIPPRPTIRCESHFPNGSIWQNVKTNETFYTVNGTIDYNVNGKWTCTHGTGWGTADVEVTVLKVKAPDLERVTENTTKKEDMKVNLSENHQCLKETVLYSLTPSFLVIMLIRLIMFCGKHFEKKRTKIAMIFPIATIVLLVFMLIVSSTEKSDCQSKYIFCPLTVVFSVLTSLFFFKGPKRIELVQQQPQQLQQQPQQLQQQPQQLQQQPQQLQQQPQQLQQQPQQLQQLQQQPQQLQQQPQQLQQLQQQPQQLQQQHQQLQQQVQQEHHQQQDNQPQQQIEGQNEENPGEPLLNSVEEQIPN